MTVADWHQGIRHLASLCAALALALALACGGCREAPTPPEEAVLVVATSLRNAMPELVKGFEAKHPGAKITASYGSSGDLKKQVEGGAPIDGVVFASEKPVDELIQAGLARSEPKRVLATNRLVLVGPKGAAPLTFATLDALPAGERLAIGDAGAVPAGQYARDALQKLGKWDAVKDRLVLGGDVAAVLTYARRGEVPAAIVYATDVVGLDDVAVLDEAKGDWAPVAKVVATTTTKGHAAGLAGELIEYAASPDGRAVLGRHGFGAP
jgi:molybdate transport system substrate-binding protein